MRSMGRDDIGKAGRASIKHNSGVAIDNAKSPIPSDRTLSSKRCLGIEKAEHSYRHRNRTHFRAASRKNSVADQDDSAKRSVEQIFPTSRGHL